MLTKIKETLKKCPGRIVFPEGEDLRILQAAARLQAEGLVVPVLLGARDKIEAVAAAGGVDVEGIECLDIAGYAGMEDMVAQMAELRRGKMSEEECRAALQKSNYFGTMLVKMGKADGLLGGATYSTADTVRPALQLVKTKPGSKIVSSCFIMNRPGTGDTDRCVMADCAINLFPTEDEIVEITIETAAMARMFGIEPKVALLSFSTKGSGKGESPEKMRNATAKLKAMNPGFEVDGELQFDAAVSPEVGQLKSPGSKVAGYANTFVFPDINAGNIGYKIAQRLGGYEALGPILMGLNAPINDLSRGTNADEVYKMALITAATARG